MKKTTRKNFIRIRRTYRALLAQQKSVKSGSTAEWLLDNFYIFAEEYGTLRHLRIPRRLRPLFKDVLSFATSFLKKENYRFTPGALDAALQDAQRSFSADFLRFLSPALVSALFSSAALYCQSPQETGDFGNIVRSLISYRELDMEAVFSSHCGVDIALRSDTAFPGMTPASKALYRTAAAQFARQSGKTDAFVAEEAARLAQGKKGSTSGAGYYLIGDGIPALRARLSLPPEKKKYREALYIGCVSLLTALCFLYIVFVSGRIFWGVLAIFPLMDIVTSILTYCIQKVTPARQLPRLSLDGGIPEKIAIVYPTLLSSEKKALEMAEKLEICYLANREENLYFGVIGDFKDSTTPTENPEIPSALEREISALCKKYGNRFFMLCREQTFRPRQGKWMGYERKRGALSDFNLFLRGRYSFRYAAGCTSSLEGMQHVITLDDDTLLPPGAARRLIGTALHPLCKPQIKNGRVQSGYGVLEPRISQRLESAGRTLFSRIFAGPGGTDTYEGTASEFYMDAFGESIFTGKGIYHVDTFLSCLSFPEDTILSHDLLEGSFIRCALVSDVQAFDSFPARLSEYSLRQHRWIRGDWQTLPWLFKMVPDAEGNKVKSALSPLSRWKIFDNLRRSLSPFFAFLLLALGNEVGALIAFLSLFLPLFLVFIDKLLYRSFSPFEKRRANIICGMLSALYRATLSIAFLAHNAYISLSGALLGLWRSFTKKNTLQWVTASDAEAARTHTLRAVYSSFLPSLSLSLVLLLACLSGIFPLGGLQLFLSLLWLSAPLLAYIIGRETPEEAYVPAAKDDALLRDTAKRIWNFFRDTMTEEDHFLPPDNLQVRPYRGIAHRTSPTNIGFGFLAPLCALELGFISVEEAAAYIERLMDSVEQLPTWQGHLYNWYDTRTLAPLSPRYVSTVDSGNFACYLLTAAMGLGRHFGADTPLVRRMVRFVENTDFRPLYSEKKKLFSIGFSPEENRLTDSYYDLLISEARQTGFLAIALGQVAPLHWFRLGRGLVESDGYRGLVSWSGTMFEYFMPLLIMQNYDNSLLSETYRFALQCQKRLSRRLRIPWGVSESGFYGFDSEGSYQYKAFGISELGISRQSEEDTVIAPYATLLALTTDPKSALINLRRMRREGFFGEYGFFEAADYTPSRIPANAKRGIVKSYMAHHQGMSLAAITNLLCDGVLQRHFHAYAPVRACEPLLKEQLPVGAPVIKDRHPRKAPLRHSRFRTVPCMRQFTRTDTYPCPVQLLSGGSYHLFIDTHGRGQSSLSGVALNAFSPLEGGGTAVWIVNPLTGAVIDGYGSACTFGENRADFSGEAGAISTRLSVSVANESPCEIRRLTIENKSGKERNYEVYFYLEPILSSPRAHAAHPAFSRLFLTTSAKDGILYARRRTRNTDEKTFLGFAAGFVEGETDVPFQFDTDRLSFFGRGTPLPKTLTPGKLPAGKTGTVLDPCFAIKLRVSLPPGGCRSVLFLAGLCESESVASKIVSRYKGGEASAETTPPMFAFKEGEEARCLHAAAFALFGGAMQKELLEARSKNKKPKEALWRLGISGDWPILLLRVSAAEHAPLLEEICKAHAYWLYHGLRTDLVLYCDEPVAYTQPIYEMSNKQKGAFVYVLGRNDLESGDLTLLTAAAFLYVDCETNVWSSLPTFSALPPARAPKPGAEEGALPPLSLCFSNGLGGFDKETGDYVISLRHSGDTPLPWSHVIANEHFGFLTDESGSGYTWSGNSQAFRLSPWFCDPVRTPLSERLSLMEGKDIWSPLAGTFPEAGHFQVRYGMGYAVYTRNTRHLLQTATLFVSSDRAEKHILLEVENQEARTRHLIIEYAFLPVLGTRMAPDALEIVTSETGARVRNIFDTDGRTVYLTASGAASYEKAGHLITAKIKAKLEPNEQKTFHFTLGTEKPTPQGAPLLLSAVKENWGTLLGALSVETGDAAIDFMLNRWLPYQATACRLFARSAFYQSGGAFGFRDQLQDTLALIDTAPHLVRRQILLHAAHQFTEGDVFHWWHSDGKGVRTRFSDDRLFLPYLAAIYAEETGDTSIWDAEESFVVEPPLGTNEEERFTHIKERTAPHSLYEHAVRAIDSSLKKGDHGLPLIGGGDWNDGMNKIGLMGKGESVWLAWFLKVVLDAFIPVCEKRGDKERAARYRRESLLLLEAAEDTFSGTQYARAFFDDGTSLGTPDCRECSIDAISQAWAVMAGANAAHAKIAMESVFQNLVSIPDGLIKLLTPPFENTSPSPGYIQSYPKGLRENGGQYTHGAIWAVLAFALLKDKERAWDLYRMLLPVLHTETPGEVQKYMAEPYVMAADVYTAPGKVGRAGWTWYTGAAAWMYRVGIRYLVGFRRKGNRVSFSPCMPIPEDGITLRYRYGKSTYIFHVFGESEEITLTDDGNTHTFEIKPD